MVLNFAKGMIFLFVTGLGVMGNVSVSVNYMFSFGGNNEKKSIHLILVHLALTNIMILLAKGLPKAAVELGLRNFLDDIGCKMIVYLERVARGLSICTSSLLAVVQAVTVSPRASGWRRLKLRSSWHILLFFSFFWMLNFLISTNLLNSISSGSLNMSQPDNDNYCYFLPESQKIKWIYLSLMVFRDALSQGVMGGASGYMVCLLHQHHQQALYLRKSKLLHRTPPELRAAQSVLLLMLCFLFFYWADCVCSLLLSLFLAKNYLMVNIHQFLVLGYATLCPFVLIHRNGHLAECWRSLCWEKLRQCLLH